MAFMDKYESVTNLFKNAPGSFAIDFVELVTLIVIISWLSNLLSMTSEGLAGALISRIVIALMGIIGYGFVMVPAMLISKITGLSQDNSAVTYFISELKSSSIGKSISSAISIAVIFIGFVIVLETQYGSITNVLGSALAGVSSWGAVIVMFMGFYFLLRTIKK